MSDTPTPRPSPITEAGVQAACEAYIDATDDRLPTKQVWQAALAAYEQAAWQPIETAPKDGTKLLLWVPEIESQVVGWWRNVWQTVWDGDEIEDEPTCKVTHWRPLSAAPDAAGER